MAAADAKSDPVTLSRSQAWALGLKQMVDAAIETELLGKVVDQLTKKSGQSGAQKRAKQKAKRNAQMALQELKFKNEMAVIEKQRENAKEYEATIAKLKETYSENEIVDIQLAIQRVLKRLPHISAAVEPLPFQDIQTKYKLSDAVFDTLCGNELQRVARLFS